jgi:hypothetical protein
LLQIAALLATMTAGQTSQAEELSLLTFRAEGVSASNSVGSTQSVIGSWVPTYSLGAGFSVLGSIGASAYRDVNETKITIVNVGVLGAYSFMDALGVELGVGTQKWVTRDSYSAISANFTWKPETSLIGSSSKLIFGASSVGTEPKTTEIRLGFEVNFGTTTSAAADSTATGGEDVAK